MRVPAALLATVALVIGVLWLRDRTLTTHSAMPPDSAVVVTLRAQTGADRTGHPPELLVEALVISCHVEVGAALVGDVVPLGDERFRFRLEPALDDADRRQLRGCLEDFRIDHVLADVESMNERLPADDPPLTGPPPGAG